MEKTTLSYAASADAAKIYRQSSDLNIANFNSTAVVGNFADSMKNAIVFDAEITVENNLPSIEIVIEDLE